MILQKTCLLIIPKKFYFFEKNITDALNDKGYKVTVSNDEYPEGILGKIMGKLQLPFVFIKTYKIIYNRYLKDKSYDVALIFKGRGMSGKLIMAIEKSVKKIIAYNWDSFKYNPGPLKWYRSVSQYFTFDYDDAAKYNIPVVELFTSFTAALPKQKNIKYDLSYIVRNHSERLQYIDAILNILKPESVYIYIYEMNVFTFIENFIKNPRLYLKYRKYIHNKPLSYADYTKVINDSAFTVDYAHSDQTGITMRCYEAVKMNTKLITNNTHISKSKYFNPSNTIVYNLNQHADILLKGIAKCKTLPFSAKTRDINDFIGEILGFNRNTEPAHLNLSM